MSETFERPNIRVKSTRNVPNPNAYIQALKGEFAEWAFDEERTPQLKGLWRDVFGNNGAPIDLEIGTGNGFHFAHHARTNPQRNLVGFELKYKPLIQSIRRAVKSGCGNARICRYDAHLVGDVFAEGELADVYIHFPDPYLKKKLNKRRLINPLFLRTLFALQKPGSRLFFKTDSEPYFDWAMEHLRASSYELSGESRDLHRSEFAESNFVTAFENIFLRQGLPIYYARFERI